MTSTLLSLHSPFEPRLLDDASIWSCDSTNYSKSFVGSNFRSCSSIDTDNSSIAATTTSRFPTTFTLFGNPFSSVDTKREWSESGVLQSSGKESLISTDDDGWKDLESSLISTMAISHLQDIATFEAPITVDDSGRRDINGVALHEELKHFSGVVRLPTFMEIFKVDSFSRTVEFFSVLRTQCNIIFDPRVGSMIIFRKHVYVPARRVVVAHVEPPIFARHYGMNPNTSVPEGSRIYKRSSPRFVITKSPSSDGTKSRLSFTSPSLKLPDKASVFDFVDATKDAATTKQVAFERCEDKALLRKRNRRRPQVRRKRRF